MVMVLIILIVMKNIKIDQYLTKLKFKQKQTMIIKMINPN
jgi:hypothetical protein